MMGVDGLFARYVAEHQAGGAADPRAYLARAAPAERAQLAALIDAYLARAPRRPFDPSEFAGSTAERTVDELQRALAGQAGLWPALLPALRDRAGLRRGELVQRLSAALGVAGQSEKVAGYYHAMEQGRLEAERVSDRVLDALGQIVGESADALRSAGEAITPGPPLLDTGAAFARHASTEPREPAAEPPPETPQAGWDEVDWLFRGA